MGGLADYQDKARQGCWQPPRRRRACPGALEGGEPRWPGGEADFRGAAEHRTPRVADRKRKRHSERLQAGSPGLTRPRSPGGCGRGPWAGGAWPRSAWPPGFWRPRSEVRLGRELLQEPSPCIADSRLQDGSARGGQERGRCPSCVPSPRTLGPRWAPGVAGAGCE